MMSIDPLIPLAQVAVLLGAVSVRHVWRLIATGKLPKPVKEARKAMLFQSDIERYLEERRRERER